MFLAAEELNSFQLLLLHLSIEMFLEMCNY